MMNTFKAALSALAVLISISAAALPAKPGKFKYTQPDGTTVMLERHGDEFFHWTTIAGTSQVVELDEDGFWRNSTLDEGARALALERRAQVNRERRGIAPRTHTDNIMTHGERHIPVFLVNFSDKAFSISSPNEKFTNLLNQRGYSYNGATGSVQDFYVDNSGGTFTPVFDVYGPVTLDNNMAYYGKNVNNSDQRPEEALFHACQKLDDEIDFSEYDYDNDGLVDMCLFYYAGYSEAEGGPANSIWPHSWNAYYNSTIRNTYFDGKRLGNYFCTAELKNYWGSTMCSIGPTCHEFGHSLGLPDFYDTDYETNGEAGGLYVFSTMCAGPYNNDSNTPPYFNAEERVYLGWMIPEDIPELPSGLNEISPVQGDIAYRTSTDTEGEYFIYECRNGQGWDSPLPEGLLIYHVDKSTVRKVGGNTPYEHWNDWYYYNAINAYGNHPCFYIIPAASPKSLNYSGDESRIVFPGANKVTSYTPIDWNKKETGVVISDIAYAGGRVSLYVTREGDEPDEPVEPEKPETLATFGHDCIADPGFGSYEQGAEFALELLLAEGHEASSVSWSVDGVAVTSATVALTAGDHLIRADVVLTDGTRETLKLAVTAK